MEACSLVNKTFSNVFSKELRKSTRNTFSRKNGFIPASAKFELQPLPYELTALEPHISSNTLEFHWGKHHRAYVDNLNKQVEGTDLANLPLEELVKETYNSGTPTPAFNNAGQAFNHQFYWESIKAGGGGKPSGTLLALIERDFGSYEKFATDFKQAGATQFGSGWAWLVVKGGKLEITKTANALSPLVFDEYPLLTVDVWEHAYYLDFQNRRPAYLDTFLESLVSWDAVSERLEAAVAKGLTSV